MTFAALVEQIAAAASSLSQQILQLQQAVDEFKLDYDGMRSSVPSPVRSAPVPSVWEAIEANRLRCS
ncbi:MULTISPECIES: hypothetical protein [unclassified Paraburkholderia]|uniref:hypothetical protein n=1 Tax=unclassified Paraburkholderia TaxID=2615204 RepID=UPI001837D055|nr:MULTISPECIES: hypothetical protein [unclassified Paraburkholderia]MBB5448430.1 hypothetical protein [Paraburkholderia sp. WSM4177]MBB5488812.1 hypothetical protein [Paraburkholderia sp. WSM4180]